MQRVCRQKHRQHLPFLGRQFAHQAQAGLAYVGDVDLAHLQVNFARLDLAQIENVIDQGEQVLAAFHHIVERLALPAVDRAVDFVLE